MTETAPEVIRPEIAIMSDRRMQELIETGEPVKWGCRGPAATVTGQHARDGNCYFTFLRHDNGQQVEVYASYAYHAEQVMWTLAGDFS